MVQPEHAESQWQLCPAPGGKDVIGPVVPMLSIATVWPGPGCVRVTVRVAGTQAQRDK